MISRRAILTAIIKGADKQRTTHAEILFLHHFSRDATLSSCFRCFSEFSPLIAVIHSRRRLALRLPVRWATPLTSDLSPDLVELIPFASSDLQLFRRSFLFCFVFVSPFISWPLRFLPYSIYCYCFSIWLFLFIYTLSSVHTVYFAIDSRPVLKRTLPFSYYWQMTLSSIYHNSTNDYQK